jgi:hypothetical protein
VVDFIRYLDMLPTTFGNPLWFTDDELLELKGTTLYQATELQVKQFLGTSTRPIGTKWLDQFFFFWWVTISRMPLI